MKMEKEPFKFEHADVVPGRVILYFSGDYSTLFDRHDLDGLGDSVARVLTRKQGRRELSFEQKLDKIIDLLGNKEDSENIEGVVK